MHFVIMLKEWKINSCLGDGWNKHGENETLKELVNYLIKTLLRATAGNITVSVLLQGEVSDYKKKKYRQLRFEWSRGATGF